MCAQIEIGGTNAKMHVQGMFIVSEPLNKRHMVRVVQHMFGRDGDRSWSTNLSWPPLGNTTQARIYCSKPTLSDREWTAGDRAVGTETYEYGLFEDIDGHQPAQGERSDLTDIYEFIESDPTTSFTDMLDHFRVEAKTLADEVASHNESKPRRIVPERMAEASYGIAFWPTPSPTHYCSDGSLWREWEVRGERALHEYIFNALSRQRKTRGSFLQFFKLLQRKPEMQGMLFGYPKSVHSQFRVQNGELCFCRTNQESDRSRYEIREYCPDCAPDARRYVHEHPYSGRCLCRRQSPPYYSD